MKNILFINCLFVISTQLVAQNFQKLYKETVPSTVTIMTDHMITGSGWHIAKNLIVTNRHVVAGASSVTVKYASGKTITTTQIRALDTQNDLCVLAVETNESFLKTESSISVGEKVFTIGATLGDYEFTLSEGIISGIRNMDKDLIPKIQTTTPISAGNSGGPLVNKKGEVIGVIVSRNDGGQNVNFAIPISQLLKLKISNESYSLSNIYPIDEIEKAKWAEEWSYAAMSHENERKFVNAEMSYRKSLSYVPSPEKYIQLSAALYKQDKFQEALETLSVSLKIWKDQKEEFWVMVGYSQMALKDYKRALAAFKKIGIDKVNEYNLKEYITSCELMIKNK